MTSAVPRRQGTLLPGAVVSLTVVSLATLSATLPDSADAAGTREVVLDFEDEISFANAGTAATTVRVVVRDGGWVKKVARRSGYSIDLPAFASTDPSPQAGVLVTDGGGADDLSPGAAPFSFGADVRLDEVSEGSAKDNGNNVVQRGLYGDPAQLKLQTDDARPTCRVKGSSGAVLVRSSRRIQALTWYSLRCQRTAGTVTLTVTRTHDGATWTYRADGPTGIVRPASSQPLSVGVKVNDAGRIAASADQFNGRLDNVFLDIAD